MYYKLGDIVYWLNDPTDDGEVIEATECKVKISWNKSGGIQYYDNKQYNDIKIKTRAENKEKSFVFVNYDGCIIEFEGKKYKLILVE